MQRNQNIARLQAGYLFPEIERRKRAFLEQNPAARVISLGIGNTTEPLTPHIVAAMKDAVIGLSTAEGYSGYDDDAVGQALRQRLTARIAARWYGGAVDPAEITVSDGAKPDCGRLQMLFGSNASVAVQDPAYPVYADGSVIIGVGVSHRESFPSGGITYMPCTPENGFCPVLEGLPRTDLIYWCSPNNPTGAASTREQLAALVQFARRNRSIIIFDAAYSAFVQDEGVPRSIFEIEGSREVALEVNSLSKSVGFAGVRLGWTVVPRELVFDDGTPVLEDWRRIMATLFNGASNIAQYGALAALDDEGLAEMRQTVGYYMENARIIRQALTRLGIAAYGGVNSPYVWAHFPGQDSWNVFEHLLQKAHVLTTPGSGFGPSGAGFVRFSAFGHREDISEAAQRLAGAWG